MDAKCIFGTMKIDICMYALLFTGANVEYIRLKNVCLMLPSFKVNILLRLYIYIYIYKCAGYSK